MRAKVSLCYDQSTMTINYERTLYTRWLTQHPSLNLKPKKDYELHFLEHKAEKSLNEESQLDLTQPQK